MSIYNLLYCLWRRISHDAGLPLDVRDYLVLHFIVPFEKAKRESVLIDALYETTIIEDKESGITECNANVRELHYLEFTRLTSKKSVELDLRIRDQRVTRYLVLAYHFDPRRFLTHPAFYNGLGKGDIEIFRLCFINGWQDQCKGLKSFVEEQAALLSSQLRWNNKDMRYIRSLTRYCLQEKIDSPIEKFIIKSEELKVNPWVIWNQLTKEEADRLHCLKLRTQLSKYYHSSRSS